jgi:hypothetical protein
VEEAAGGSGGLCAQTSRSEQGMRTIAVAL